MCLFNITQPTIHVMLLIVDEFFQLCVFYRNEEEKEWKNGNNKLCMWRQQQQITRFRIDTFFSWLKEIYEFFLSLLCDKKKLSKFMTDSLGLAKFTKSLKALKKFTGG